MKLRGYQKFEIALAHNPSLEDEMPQLSSKVTVDDTIDELSSKMLVTTVNALTETHNLIDSNDVSEAVDWIVKGEN